jgi:alpha-N-arabinofuranosidase
MIHNPVLRGFHPDPSVCRVGSKFYLVTSTFEFFPGIPVYRSDDLYHWECIAHVIDRRGQIDYRRIGASRGLFAPTIRHHDGGWFVTVTNVSGPGNCLFVADKPTGRWSDPIHIPIEGIDPSLFFDDDGTAYVLTNGGLAGKSGIIMAPVDLSSGLLLDAPALICQGTGGRYPEGPRLYRIGKWYFLMLAEGGTEYGHMVTLFRSQNLTGPYEACPYGPILTMRDDAQSPLQCTGHADLVDDETGGWHALFLGVRPLRGVLLHNLGRETCLGNVLFRDDGWFFIEPMPSGDGVQEIVLSPSAEYLSPRIPAYPMVWLKGESVRIRGNGGSLSDSFGNPSFFGIRQTEHALLFRCIADACSSDAIFGVSAYAGSGYHYDVVADFGRRTLSLWHCLHGYRYRLARIAFPDGFPSSVCLEVTANSQRYQFRWGASPSHMRTMGTGSCAGLCAEGTRAMSFIGTLVGPFVENGEADFHSCP